MFRLHVWANIEIVHAFQRIEFDCIAPKVTRKKGCADTIFPLFAFSLNIVQKDGEMGSVSVGQSVIEKFVHKHFTESIFAGCFHGTDGTHIRI